MTTDDDQARCRCITCGEHMVADTYDDLWVKYTDHQVREHGKPSMGETGGGRA